MALPTTKRLIGRAEKGEKLTPKERRQCIGYFMVAEPETSNTDLAALFRVSERMIRFDQKAIKEQIAKEYAGLDPTVIVGELMMMRDRQIANIERSLKKAVEGSRTYLAHCVAINKILTDTTKTLQDLGVLPKELGNLQVESYEYKAYVIKDGQVETRALHMPNQTIPQLPGEDRPRGIGRRIHRHPTVACDCEGRCHQRSRKNRARHRTHR
jgi:hypothetical protein